MKKALLFVFVCILVALPLTAGAQFSAPLVITLNGDMWSWYGDPNTTPVSLTQWGWNEPGVLSPDGGRIAYNSLSSVVVDAFARGAAAAGGSLPSNIWVLNPANGDGFRVAEQPAGASFAAEGVADFGVSRSAPAWSPSGRQLVWAEQTYPAPSDSIVVYDFGSGAAQTIVSGLPPSAGVPAPKEVLWGQSGIIVRDVQQGASGVADTFTVYAPNGGFITSFSTGGGGRFLIYYALMQAGGREVLGVLFNDAVWDIYDLTSGASQVAPGIPELYSLRAGDSSLALAPFVNDVGGFSWRLLAPDGTTLTEFVSAPYFVPQRYALSPDGQAIAYSDYLEDQRVIADSVNVWQNGTVTVVPNPVGFPLIGGVLWSPLGWRVRAGVG